MYVHIPEGLRVEGYSRQYNLGQTTLHRITPLQLLQLLQWNTYNINDFIPDEVDINPLVVFWILCDFWNKGTVYNLKERSNS